MVSQTDKKRKLKKGEILNRAMEVFRVKGFRTTTMDDIASELMLTKGSLYYYFNSKEEIIYNAQDYALDLVNRIIKRIDLSASPETKLKLFLSEYMQVIMTEPMALLVALQFEPLGGEYCERIFDKRSILEGALQGILSEGISSGVFEPGNPKILGFVILGALNWITRWYSTKEEMNAGQVTGDVLDILIRAVLKQKMNISGLCQNLIEISSLLEKCALSFERLESEIHLQTLGPGRKKG